MIRYLVAWRVYAIFKKMQQMVREKRIRERTGIRHHWALQCVYAFIKMMKGFFIGAYTLEGTSRHFER